MSASTGSLLTLLRGGDPVAVVFYRDEDAREDLLGLCQVLAGKEIRRTDVVDDVFLPQNASVLLALTPVDEREAVRVLDGRREQLLVRSAPAVLFVLQGGSAEAALNSEAPALSNFLRGLTYDPTPPPDDIELATSREAFHLRHGRTPEEWLASWQEGELADTEENNFIAHEAWGLRSA